jgi:putative membrane protein
MEETKLGLSDILALDRTRLAAERTLMGWIRTCFSMMTFGFTVFKVMEELRLFTAQRLTPLQGARELGLALAGIGTFALLFACLQHWTYMRRLKRAMWHAPYDLALTVAILVVGLGLSIVGGLTLRIGPFS